MNLKYIYKYILVFIPIIFVVCFSFGYTNAQDVHLEDQLLQGFFCGVPERGKDIDKVADEKNYLQLKWPIIGDNDLEEISGEDRISLGKLVNYMYSLSLWIAIVIAFLSLIGGGFMYMGSGDNPAKMKDAMKKIKNVFLGILIIMISVLILNIINPELKQVSPYCEVNDCEEYGTGGEGIELPDSTSGTGVFLRQSKFGDYSGIPYTNEEGGDLLYKNILSVPSSTRTQKKCTGCDGNYSQDNNAIVSSVRGGSIDNYPAPVCRFYCDGDDNRDRVRDFLEHSCYRGAVSDVYSTTASKYIIVNNSFATAQANCASMCVVMSGDSGGSCRGVEGSEKFYAWIDHNLNVYNNNIKKVDNGYNKHNKINFKFYMSRPKNAHFLDIFEDENDVNIDRKAFRECIGKNYVLDSQDVSGVKGSVCLCK